MYIYTVVENFNYLTAHNPVMTRDMYTYLLHSLSLALLFSCQNPGKYCLDITLREKNILFKPTKWSNINGILVRQQETEFLVNNQKFRFGFIKMLFLLDPFVSLIKMFFSV